MHRNAETLIDDGVNVGIARQLAVQNAEDGRVESVLIRIDLREQLKDRMRVIDDLEIFAVLCGLRERVSARSLFEISEEI